MARKVKALGKGVIQAIQSRPVTFGELTESILQYVVKLALQHKCSQIDFVTDQYSEMSIKNLQRSQRAVGVTRQMQIYGRDQKTPTQWKKFLSVEQSSTGRVSLCFMGRL